MFKSKHSGWTWDLKRTPFGNGGGIISSITDPISSALGTDGSGGGVLGALASVDPGPAIGSALASVDQAVNQIPGGWITVAGLGAGGATLAYAPEVMALASSSGIAPEAAAVQLGIAPVDATTGATVPLESLGASTGTGLTTDASATGLTTDASATGLTPSALSNAGVPQSTIDSLGTGLTGGTGGSTGILTGGSTSGLTIPTDSAIAVDPSIAASTGADLSAAGTTSTGAATGAGLSGVNGLNPALPAAGANAGAGTGLSAALAPNTVLGTGLAGGGDIGVAYQLGANGLPATDWLGNPIQASSIGLNGSTVASSFSNTLPNPTQLATAIKNLGSATQKNATQSLPTVNYQSAFLPSSQTVPIEGSRLTTTPTALKLASLLS